jgi:hypothetical protein
MPGASDPGAPALTGDIAVDGLNWFNFRRSQAGLSVLTSSSIISMAAQNHSDYQRTQGGDPAHEEVAGKPGFTGVNDTDRLKTVGYALQNGWAAGEVISGLKSQSGAFMAEELITAIYHRFAIFEPVFKEIGAGAATATGGYTYFTAEMTATNGFGPGLGNGNMINWPFDGQVRVPTNFFSDYEYPSDPVPGLNEVGYPISVHADIKATLKVTSFSVKERGGVDLSVKQLNSLVDPNTPPSAAAIIPLAVLKSKTTYDVTFVGTASGVPITRIWSFTTL